MRGNQRRSLVPFLFWILLSCSPFLNVRAQTCPYRMYEWGFVHTGCLPPNTSCTTTNRGVNQADQDLILRIHNQLRSKTAQGKQSGASGYMLPMAANMRQLRWSSELAALAQKHTEQCTLNFDCFNCRRVEDYPTGAMLYYIPDDGQFQTAMWSSALNNLIASSSNVNSIKAGQFRISSFTQMIWGMTKDIGCGFTRYKSFDASQGRRAMSVYYCLYGPAGNYGDMDIYEEGDTCSDCTYKNTCCGSTCANADFLGLCKLNN